MRIITALTSLITIGTAIWCFANSGAAFIALAFVVGVVMIIQGLGGIFSYIGARKELEKSSWILAESICTGILGVIVLFNQITIEAMLPLFFGMWIMYSGMMGTIASIHIIIARERTWIWCLILGLMNIAIGVYCFFNSILLCLEPVTLVAMTFLSQGANIMALAVNLPGKYKIYPKEENEEAV